MEGATRFIDGFAFPAAFPEENFDLIQNAPLRTGDIVLATYPKCGTNWLAYIMWSILNPEEPAPDSKRVAADYVFVDLLGLKQWADIPEGQSRKMSTHLPFERVKQRDDVKYVVVIRNPLDCCVSFYHFIKRFSGVNYKVDEGIEVPTAFVDDFTAGTVTYGDFFTHFKSWYAHKDDPNVHVVIFEKLKENPHEEVLSLAKFLGHEKALEANDGQLLNKIIEQSSFNVMKNNLQYIHPTEKTKMEIVRKGEAGGYRNSLTPSQIEPLKIKMLKELEGMEILDIWRNV